MKRMLCTLLCGVLLTALSACGGSGPVPAETEPQAETVTFTDDLGREVTVTELASTLRMEPAELMLDMEEEI